MSKTPPAGRRARRSPRHPLHDYCQPGLYFVTVCTADRQPVFGMVRTEGRRQPAGEMCRSAFGDIAHEEWLRTFEMRPYLVSDVFIVMPDHVHLLFGIRPHDGISALGHRSRDTPPVCPYYPDERRFGGAQAHSVSSIMRQYKSIVTKRIRQIDPTVCVWQSRFHDRVVRNEREAEAIRAYIRANPANWRPSSWRERP